jgi:penicillin-binding protein 1A
VSEPQDIEETPGATLTDDEIETHRIGGASRPAASTADDGDDTGDTGDDTGDVSDPSDTGDDSGDSSDTGDDSGSDS